MKKKVITEDAVSKALEDLEAQLQNNSEDVVKASEDDLDQPEGADLGNPAKDKMSDAAKAKKAKKAMGKGDLTITHEDEDEDEDDSEEMEKKMKAKKAKKSFSEEMPEEIQTKIDVSEFLKSLVDHTGSTIEGLSREIAKSEQHNDARYADLADAVEDVQKSQAKIGIVLKAICEKIGVIAAAPARAAKADTVAKSDASAPAQRSFEAASAEVVEEKGKAFGGLSDNPVIAKSQISSALCDMVRKGEAEDLDVIGFESGGYIRPEIATKLKQVLN